MENGDRSMDKPTANSAALRLLFKSYALYEKFKLDLDPLLCQLTDVKKAGQSCVPLVERFGANSAYSISVDSQHELHRRRRSSASLENVKETRGESGEPSSEQISNILNYKLPKTLPSGAQADGGGKAGERRGSGGARARGAGPEESTQWILVEVARNSIRISICFEPQRRELKLALNQLLKQLACSLKIQSHWNSRSSEAGKQRPAIWQPLTDKENAREEENLNQTKPLSSRLNPGSNTKGFCNTKKISDAVEFDDVDVVHDFPDSYEICDPDEDHSVLESWKSFFLTPYTVAQSFSEEPRMIETDSSLSQEDIHRDFSRRPPPESFNASSYQLKYTRKSLLRVTPVANFDLTFVVTAAHTSEHGETALLEIIDEFLEELAQSYVRVASQTYAQACALGDYFVQARDFCSTI